MTFGPPPTPDPAPPRRPAGRWVVLLLAWAVGLAVWAFYIGMIVVLLVRWL